MCPMTDESANQAIHPAALPIHELRDLCELRFQRRSGPGGQHRNKVETSVHISHRPTGISVAASERRAQSQNLKVAWQRLRIQLATEIRRPWSSPSENWRRRCRGRRVIINKQHDDFPTLLAEALDALAAADWHQRSAATALGCSTTQLVRLLSREPKAMATLNRHRATIGLEPLKHS